MASASAITGESLRYALVIHDHQDIHLLRDELRDAPADSLSFQQRPLSSNGSFRKVLWAETVPIEAERLVEIRGSLGKETTPQPGQPTPGISIKIERPQDALGAFDVELEILQHWEAYKDRTTRLVARCRTPAQPNAWQEVLSSSGFSVWQYYTPLAGAPNPAPSSADSETLPVYRLDLRFGQLSRESLDKLPTHSAEHRQLIADLDWWREIYTLHVSPDHPFSLTSSRCQKDKLTQSDHEEQCTIRIDGSVEITPSHLGLDIRYRNQAKKKQDRHITPLGVEMLSDQWYFQPFKQPTPVDYPVEGAWCETTWAERSASPCTNIAAYRLTKVWPIPSPAAP